MKRAKTFFFIFFVYIFFVIYINGTTLIAMPKLLMFNDSDIAQIRKEVEKSSLKRLSSRFTSYEIFTALREAYPLRVTGVQYLNGDWSALIGGVRLYWAQGRMLSYELKDNWEGYARYSFYRYSTAWPIENTFRPQDVMRIIERDEEKEKKVPLQTHPKFRTLLHKIDSYSTSENELAAVKIYAFTPTMHKDLDPIIKKLDEDISALANRDIEVRNFLRNTKVMSGWSWRNIAGTNTLSLHSFGIALDILPFNFNGKHSYWRWTRAQNKEWFEVSVEERYMPPKSFVSLFEKYGFLWGGKWFYFDTLHFEYRPEIFLLNGINYIKVLPDSEP
jgi:hypothetical protein